MVSGCFVLNCDSSRSEQISFHRIPTGERGQQWLNFCGRKDFILHKRWGYPLPPCFLVNVSAI